MTELLSYWVVYNKTTIQKMLFIYVIELQNDKYYVGKTVNPHYRIETHFTNNGAEWTKLYKPIKILELIPNCDNYDEDNYTY